jgi:hypothetical protein
MFIRKLAVGLLAPLCLFTSLVAGGVSLDYYLPAGTDYDPKVPAPEQFLGWQPGDWHLRSDQVVAYLQAVAAVAPDRVKFEIMGYSHEHKPLVLLTITSPENHRNLEKIRLAHLALLDPSRKSSPDLAAMPVVINQGYSIHGNEPSGVNAMVVYVYHLAAARGPVITQQLQQAVILIEAQRNPDGGDRAAQWFNQHKSLSAPSADPSDREHNEAWPGGRYNHYWFDPNRDWLPLVHPEARARAELFHRWRPNVLTDHHEMMSARTFFFQPGVPTRTNPSTPAQIRELTAEIATFHQRALDRHGALYFSEQGYDDFYPGKGSTYPDLHGSVGILFEQATARGHVMESESGVLTFAYAIRNQVLTSLSSLEAAIALRPKLLVAQKDFARETAALAEKSPVQAYIFGDGGDAVRARDFVELLARHHIEVHPLKQPVTQADDTFLPGAAWVVPVRQAQFRLLTEIFTKRTEFEENIFYDVSAWNLALAYNLPFAALATLPSVEGSLTGLPPAAQGVLVGGHSDYAYLFAWTSPNAPRALWRLQQAGIHVKGLTGAPIEAVGADGTRMTFQPGAVLVPVGIQPEKAATIHGIIDRMVQEYAIAVLGCGTGLTPVGVDFGSVSFQTLKPPGVALITGQGVDAQEIGAAWFGLDQRVGLSPTLLDVAQLGRADLDRYQFIYFANGSYDTSVSDATVAELKRWVRNGGTLMLTGRAMAWAAKAELAVLDFVPSLVKPAVKTKETETVAVVSSREAYATAADQAALKLVAGAIFSVSVDRTHPLGYGLVNEHLSLCRTNTIFLKPAKSAYETPAIYTAQPLLAGYASAENQKLAANSAAMVALSVGKGAVVAMPDSPVFRGFWRGGERLFFNAVFYGQTISSFKSGEAGSDAANDQ